MSSFLEAVQVVLSHEGGYSDHSLDSGGPTNWGISLQFAQSVDPLITIDDIKNLSREKAINLYFECFWKPNRYGEISCDIIATKIFDACVNLGANSANHMFQEAINKVGAALIVDGVCGSKTIAAANSVNSIPLLINMRINMREFYRTLAKNTNQQVFLTGWLKRADW